MNIYDKVAGKCSEITTKLYSTSFSISILLLKRKYREAIYGYVRFADEIVDTFYHNQQLKLFNKFKKDTFKAIEQKISLNPILHSFQLVVNKYNIDLELIESFLHSMEMDLYKHEYNDKEYNRYIYGSAEVVGLMCLQIFYANNRNRYNELMPYARKLGQALQKINFLRDIKQDYLMRERVYFPGVNMETFSENDKVFIEKEIQEDLDGAYRGIYLLKRDVRIGVLLAYLYFNSLFKKIKRTKSAYLLETRIRVRNSYKLLLLIYAWFIITFKLYNKRRLKRLDLDVEIDNKSGFCFGVVNAIKKAEENLNGEDVLYCLGDIVHNEEEINRLKKKGLKIIHYDEMKNLKNEKVLFRAHGEPPASYESMKENSNVVIDASCSIIIKFQKRIKEAYDKGEKILIFGKKNHPEIIGLNGQIDNNAIVFDSIDDLNFKDLPKKLSLFSQTTKDKNDYESVSRQLIAAGFEVNMNNTICKQVSNRQDDLLDFCKRFDKIVFIAGENSSNGKILYNICKKENSNTIFISSPYELKRSMFNERDKIGICGATSTPNWLFEETKAMLESY